MECGRVLCLLVRDTLPFLPLQLKAYAVMFYIPMGVFSVCGKIVEYAELI